MRMAMEEPSPPIETTPSRGAPADSDAAFVERYLRGLGWSRPKIGKILAGPSEAHVEEIAAREVPGRRAGKFVNGRRVAQADGQKIELVDGQRVATSTARVLQLLRDYQNLNSDHATGFRSLVAGDALAFGESWERADVSDISPEEVDRYRATGQGRVNPSTPGPVYTDYKALPEEDRRRFLRLVDQSERGQAKAQWARLNLDGARRIVDGTRVSTKAAESTPRTGLDVYRRFRALPLAERVKFAADLLRRGEFGIYDASSAPPKSKFTVDMLEPQGGYSSALDAERDYSALTPIEKVTFLMLVDEVDDRELRDALRPEKEKLARPT